jgi:hypothetical protein
MAFAIQLRQERHLPPNMPPLTGLKFLSGWIFYKYAAPTALGSARRQLWKISCRW